MHDVQVFADPEHWAQFELQGTQFPLMGVNPFAQDSTHLPFETTPDSQTQILL